MQVVSSLEEVDLASIAVADQEIIGIRGRMTDRLVYLPIGHQECTIDQAATMILAQTEVPEMVATDEMEDVHLLIEDHHRLHDRQMMTDVSH